MFLNPALVLDAIVVEMQTLFGALVSEAYLKPAA
jgi:hypothetical protein